MNPTYAKMGTTIFEKMSAIARETGAINLGQGFPEHPGPPEIREAAARALMERSNQYPPMAGLPELRRAVADHYAQHQGLDLTPDEVIVTSGATEAIAATLLALISPGDEVVLIQPLYDAYLPLVERAGGIARLVTLEPPHWLIKAEAIERAITPKTRLLLLNSPLNPAGTIASAEELAIIADACIHRVGDTANRDEVISRTTAEDIPAAPSVQGVVVIAPREAIITQATSQLILPRARNENVGPVAAAEKVRAVVAVDHIVAAITGQRVVQRRAVDRVIASAAGKCRRRAK